MTMGSNRADSEKGAGNNSNSVPPGQHGGQIGFAILAIVVVFVAVWMQVQGRRALLNDANTTLDAATASVDGFRPDFWQLPDEPLLGFVEIPAGVFRMGSDPVEDRQAYENERWSETERQGSMFLPDFYIGRFEVTVGQFAVFAQDSSRAFVPEAFAAEPDHPVTNITWTDALAYCRWLQNQMLESARTPGQLRDLLASGWTLTLPSEAQWEKAARGADGDIYPWGNRLRQDRANFDSATTRPVGSFDCPECRSGLSDMSGNVWEMTRSPFQPYPYTGDDDGENLSGDALWIMRGGSYADGPPNIPGCGAGWRCPGGGGGGGLGG